MSESASLFEPLGGSDRPCRRLVWVSSPCSSREETSTREGIANPPSEMLIELERKSSAAHTPKSATSQVLLPQYDGAGGSSGTAFARRRARGAAMFGGGHSLSAPGDSQGCKQKNYRGDNKKEGSVLSRNTQGQYDPCIARTMMICPESCVVNQIKLLTGGSSRRADIHACFGAPALNLLLN